MELAALRLQVPAAIDAARADALSDALVDANAATGRCSDAATDRESDAATLPIVLSGQPGLFCRGMDLAALLPGDGAEAVNPDAATLRGGVAAFGRLLRTIRGSQRPVIALVDGAVLGGGVGIAAACDVVIASKRSVFGLPEALLGLIPAVVLPALLSRMSLAQARHWVLTAYSRPGAEAHAQGLVDVLCEDDKVDAALRRCVRDLSRVRPGAVAALKRFTAQIDTLPFADGIERGVTETTETLLRPATMAAVRRFVADGEML